MKHWLQWKWYWLRCEFIYLLGGVPREHINTIHYRNIESVVKNIRKQVVE